ncbi:isoprenylcysteine carboxylmethyltransferase family protein [Methanosalsum natronophilum]|uniref:Isoprenylcysteine carboxylmethyltransferase family protein n=1 Tax=Methanosalsum natronophilum TaxID=768733 RepID=A0A3R7YH58_9EURY|nr:MAG: isoprenylcysteine carboxylmethyltransferase family protein [Methanosalsum natronophilum]
MIEIVLLTIIYFTVFAVIHSFTASLYFKRKIRYRLGPFVDKVYLPVYSLLALLTISPLVYLIYNNPGSIIYIIPTPWFWVMISIQVIAALVAPRALTDAPHRFKLRLQLGQVDNKELNHLKIKGIYKWIRDPFLLSGLVIIWFTPFMTLNLLLIYVLITIYLVFGSFHWEKRLVEQFGTEYKEYQTEVNRILPRDPNK